MHGHSTHCYDRVHSLPERRDQKRSFGLTNTGFYQMDYGCDALLCGKVTQRGRVVYRYLYHCPLGEAELYNIHKLLPVYSSVASTHII